MCPTGDTVCPNDVQATVFSWQAGLRYYVVVANSSHISIRGQPLDDALHKFMVEAGEQRQYYIETVFLCRKKPNIPELSNLVPVSPEERPLCDNFRQMAEKITRKGKQDVICVHQKVSEALVEINQSMSNA